MNHDAMPIDSEGVPAANDLAAKALMVAKLDKVGATVAAAMVRGAVVFVRGAEAAAPSRSEVRS